MSADETPTEPCICGDPRPVGTEECFGCWAERRDNEWYEDLLYHDREQERQRLG